MHSESFATPAAFNKTGQTTGNGALRADILRASGGHAAPRTAALAVAIVNRTAREDRSLWASFDTIRAALRDVGVQGHVEVHGAEHDGLVDDAWALVRRWAEVRHRVIMVG